MYLLFSQPPQWWLALSGLWPTSTGVMLVCHLSALASSCLLLPVFCLSHKGRGKNLSVHPEYKARMGINTPPGRILSSEQQTRCINSHPFPWAHGSESYSFWESHSEGQVWVLLCSRQLSNTFSPGSPSSWTHCFSLGSHSLVEHYP